MVRNCWTSWAYCACVRVAMRIVCTRFAGSITTHWARACGAVNITTSRAKPRRRAIPILPSEAGFRHRRIRRQLEVTRHVDTNPVSLPNRDRRQAVQEPIEDLHGGLGGGVRRAGDDDRPPTVRLSETGRAEVLREAGDEPDRGRGAEGREIVLVHFVLQSGVTQLIEAHELVQAVRAAVGHE